MELLIIIIGSVLAVPLVIFSSEPVRIIIGLLFVLFLPGYTLLAVLFPRKTNLDGITRLALSLGMSLALVALILLILNYTPWGYQLYSILISLILFTDIMAVVAWVRRRKYAPEERFSPVTSFKPASFFRS